MEKIFGLFDFSKAFTLQDKSKQNFYHKADNFNFRLTVDEEQYGDIIVSFSGTLYNKKAIKKECDIKEDISTTKLIQKAYELFGTSLFKKLDGVFASVIYDKKSQILYLIKDKVGIKPLYFYTHGKSTIFGTNLKDFYDIPTFSKKIDKDALSLYLRYGYILQSHTIFENTQKIKSGHYLSYDLKSRNFSQEKYWSLEECYLKEKLKSREDDILGEVKSLLQNSIKKQVDANQKIALSLSGGYDSSMVAALLTKTCGKKIDTFTIGFEDATINEAPEAKEIASYLNTNHHEHYFSSSDALDVIPRLCEVYDEPFADYAATPTLLMSELAEKSGFNTIYAGDGGDEVFATADNIAQFERILQIPSFIKKNSYKILNKIKISKIPILNEYQNIPTKYYKFLQILKATNIPQMVEVKTILFNDDEIKDLIKSEKTEFQTTFDEIKFPPFSDTVDQIIGSYFKTSMTDSELVKSYGAARNANLALKTPLLDIDLIEYMAKVPQSLKIKNGEKKYILKNIIHNQIPKELLNRPKSGFHIPFSYWLKGPLKELLFEQVNEKRIKDDSIFSVEPILKVRDNFYNGNNSYKYKLWTILIFQLWYENLTQNNKG